MVIYSVYMYIYKGTYSCIYDHICTVYIWPSILRTYCAYVSFSFSVSFTSTNHRQRAKSIRLGVWEGETDNRHVKVLLHSANRSSNANPSDPRISQKPSFTVRTAAQTPILQTSVRRASPRGYASFPNRSSKEFAIPPRRYSISVPVSTRLAKRPRPSED